MMRFIPWRSFQTKRTEISLKNNHTWGCPVYVLDVRFQGIVAVLPKWDPHSLTGIYLGHSPFYSGSVALVLNPATGNF